MKHLILKTAVLLLICIPGLSQTVPVAELIVDPGNSDRIDVPVSASLDGISSNTDQGAFRLMEIVGKERRVVPCQLEQGNNPRLWWILEGKTSPKQVRRFELYQDSLAKSETKIKVNLTPQVLTVQKDGANVLRYQVAEMFPPEGVSPMYCRSGFIHPLWSPSGNVLTRVNAPDHWHHFGIWNPWTRTRFEGHTTDFWNLYEGQGTVRFAGFNSIISGPVYGGFKVRQEHVDFQCKGGDKVALNEVWDVRIYNISSVDESKVWLWELSTTLNCATSSPLLLEAYRYGGGIGFRANEEWTNKNSWVLTSEGKNRKEADGTRARWCDVGGEFSGKGTSGILFMSNPANREYPEPMRVWPEDQNNGRGDQYFEFCPIRHKSWNLEPGNDYVLKYRMLVYDGKITPATAERIWNDFANPPKVTLLKK